MKDSIKISSIVIALLIVIMITNYFLGFFPKETNKSIIIGLISILPFYLKNIYTFFKTQNYKI